ncbi:GPI ethanolamine phosphate transferase 2-like isoform X2 [Leptotrombidium deliense]|uniref:GPI ethanolamine phosphate transferase 2-like isoform X2 n=1 Tax=Leptotrombidium deliense TaxID=299467 RepID=A0A443SHX3_9ACAR|nr:GPI ethanolamine phosphate transferase 2-like isoform X2 [Leptotrombidium deliense]
MRVVVVTLAQIIAMIIFAFGYFAVDEKIADGNTDDWVNKHTLETTKLYLKSIDQRCHESLENGIFDKFVFIVIDALRSDFVPAIDNRFEANMPFTEQLIKDKLAIAMTSKAQTPTVTMPRIKALLSGTHPNFLDLIFNLKATKFGDDNVIDRSVIKNKRIVFYGDDTWLQMFPENMFIRSNVTRSFFATDYTTVDTNVTENMKPELMRLNTWDYLILHYLGVDHIGHAHGGAKSSLLPAKLIEMDNVVKLIYEKLRLHDKRYLIVITGDHGMTEAGNHGGSTDDETNTAMIFIDTKASKSHENVNIESLSSERVRQVDFAATLSSLLGLPIPLKSVGKIILPVIRAYEPSLTKRLCHFHQNSVQMLKISLPVMTTHMRSHIEETLKKHSLYLSDNLSASDGEIIETEYVRLMNSMQLMLIEEKSHRNFWPLFISQTLNILVLVSLASFLAKSEFHLLRELWHDRLVLISLVILFMHAILLSSTSFIEMEQFFWSYISLSIASIITMCNTQALRRAFRTLNYVLVMNKKHDREVDGTVNKDYVNYLKLKVLAGVALVCVVRLSSSWHSVDYDITKWLNEKNNSCKLTALAIMSMFSMSSTISINYIGKQRVVFIAGLFWVYLFRCDTGFLLPSIFQGSLVSNIAAVHKARIAYLHIAVILLIPFVNRLNLGKYFSSSFEIKKQTFTSAIFASICCGWLLLIALLSSVCNIPLIALHVIMERLVHFCIAERGQSQSEIRYALIYVIFAMSAFYSTGNSNSISTIDVAPGYVGLSDYNVFVVGSLVTANAYSLYTFWYLMLFIRLTNNLNRTKSLSLTRFDALINLLLSIRFCVVNYYEIIAIILQNHLFIWTVICPKFLYEAFTTLLTIVLLLSFKLIIKAM